MGEPQIVVAIAGDSSKFSKATGEAIQKAQGLTGKLQGIGKGMVLGAGIGAFNLLTGAVSTAIGKLGEAHEAFLADQVSQEQLGQALRNNIPGWDGNTAGAEKFAASVAALGFTDDETRESLSQLVGVTHDLDQAQQLSSLAMDLARAKGIDLATATDIVTKAHEGNGRALKGLGIDIGGATTAAGFLDAIQKNVKGSAETWAATNEGKLAVSNVKVGEAMERVGAIVDKVSQVVIPIFAEALTRAVTGLEMVAKAVGPVVSAIASTLTPVIQKLGPLFQSTFAAISAVVQSVVKVLSGIWNTWGKDIMNVIGIAFGYVQNTIKNVMTIIQGIIKVITSAIKGDWTGVWNGIKQIIGGVWDQIRNIVTTALTFLRNIISTVWNAVSTTIKNVLTGIVTNVTTGFGKVVSFIQGIPAKIAGALGNLFRPLWEGFRKFINALISGWNSLKFTVPSIDLGPLGKIGGFTVGTPNIPYLHTGGIVPGVPGQNVLTVLQAGEMVTPRVERGGLTVQIVVNGSIYGVSGVDELSDLVARRLRLSGATIGAGGAV